MGDASLPMKLDARTLPGQVKNRPSLIDYNPVANSSAVVVASDNMARFTVLTPRVIRMEYAKSAGTFEDHSTIAILNRNTDVPSFKSSESGGVLTISTSEVTLTYYVGKGGFAPTTLSVASNNASSAFPGWTYGDAFPGNLLGTIRGLDQQDNTPLNCTQNVAILDNGEYNHCEWGMVSRDGWVVYNDTLNYILDENDWWVPNPPPPTPAPRACTAGSQNTDVSSATRSSYYPDGTTAASASDCCNLCYNADDCISWVYEPSTNNCWPLAGWSGAISASDRVFGIVSNVTNKASAQNGDAEDLYGFFHGHDYFGALADFVAISGKTIMVPKYASGVWWSRWFDLSNFDVLKVVNDHSSRSIPLDVFVLDMNWHTKDNWSGFTFDSHLFPFPKDSMDYLHALGLPVTMNLHDASGVNYWDAMFPALVQALGLPNSTTTVPFNILNATVAYAVEDIVLGDLLYNKSVNFWWIDWQQGGNQGGMSGDKQNPTIWLNHLRCTDRHRIGDNTRGMVLARWGGLGGHRYQVGFSGDVAGLTWSNLAYQPYFSSTAVNVAHGFWSHDIEGPATDMEMYTRWIQIGSFSGTMRHHDRGMSGGGCSNSNPFACSIVEPWNTPNVNFPDVFMEANRQALQFRAYLLPYVYNGHRAAFETGVGLIRPMYYHYPELDQAYAMDGNGNNVQYMFGPSILFSPVVQAGASNQNGNAPGVATKTTWLPPGTWVDANSGVVTTVAPGDSAHMLTKAYAINEIPLWYAAGSVIPYVPIESLTTSVGNAGRQYTYLGFKVVPGASSGSASVYEDDGATTAYLTDNAFAYTTATYTRGINNVTITISTAGAYPELPTSRNYQLRFLNSAPVTSVSVNGASVVYQRYGEVLANHQAPPASQYYWDFSPLPQGMGAVVDIIGASTITTTTVVVSFSPVVTDAQMAGAYGSITHAIAAKLNLDIERSTPGSNSDDPAFTSVLSSTGVALEYLAGANPAGFASAVAAIPGLLGNATAEISGMNSARKPYSVALLQNAAL